VRPNGVQGYPYVIDTEAFSVRVAGEHQVTWPGLCVELRAHFLHTHPDGARGACEDTLGWVGAQLLYDQPPAVHQQVSFAAVNVSRADLHIDWQGGFIPTFSEGEEWRFIRRRSLLWHPYIVGTTCQGYCFGSGDSLMVRNYNKTAECRRHDESYAALVAARNGEGFDPTRDVWRLEFELKREALASLKLVAELDTEDSEADIEAELSAEELPHVGTLPKLFAHLDAVFQHLSYHHWLRLAQPSRGWVRSRWPLDSSWSLLRAEFGRFAAVAPLPPEALAVVRGARWGGGRTRLLNRMAAGVLAWLEVADAEVAHVALRRLCEVME
jgi:hypothetical protein